MPKKDNSITTFCFFPFKSALHAKQNSIQLIFKISNRYFNLLGYYLMVLFCKRYAG